MFKNTREYKARHDPFNPIKRTVCIDDDVKTAIKSAIDNKLYYIGCQVKSVSVWVGLSVIEITIKLYSMDASRDELNDAIESAINSAFSNLYNSTEREETVDKFASKGYKIYIQ